MPDLLHSEAAVEDDLEILMEEVRMGVRRLNICYGE